MSSFTLTALHSEVDRVKQEALAPIVWQQFKRFDLYAEVIIQFGRGSRYYFRDAVHFWLTVLLYWFHASQFSDEDAFFANALGDNYTQCQEISFDEWSRIVHFYDFVETAHDFSLHGQFSRAWLVSEYGGQTDIVAETDEEFAVFSWELDD